MEKGQLGAGGLWTGRVKHLLAWSSASPLLPDSGSHSLCGGFTPATRRCPSQCTTCITAKPPRDKALPRNRFWPNLPALAGWKEGANNMMNTGWGLFQTLMLPAPGWGVPPILGQCSVQHQYCWVNWKGNWKIKRKKRTFSSIWWGLVAGKTFAAGLLPPCSPTTRAHSQGSKKGRAAKPAAFHGKQQGSLGNQNQLPCKGKKWLNLWFITSVEAWNKLSKCAILQLLFVFHKCS